MFPYTDAQDRVIRGFEWNDDKSVLIIHLDDGRWLQISASVGVELEAEVMADELPKRPAGKNRAFMGRRDR